MKIKTIISAFTAMILCLSALAAPARKGRIVLSQPDGSTFTAIIKGDEFTKIRTTESGHAIMQDKDGWWCYAAYGDEGRRENSGIRVGQSAPAEVLSRSAAIPYAALSAKAREKRSAIAAMDEGSAMKNLLRQRKAITKSDGDEEETGPVRKHGIVVLAQFRDQKFTYSREDFIDMLTLPDYSRNGATGSAKEYFDAQFGGSVEFDFTVSDIVTLPSDMAFYGGNDEDGSDKAPAEMIRDACRLADEQIDFSLYDDDKDGDVDNVFVFFAGPDEAEGASEDCIWSHAWYVYNGAGISLYLDGKRINRYACTSELTRRYSSSTSYEEFISGIGTFCHEYSHTFGLPDFYDTNYDDEGGWAAGLWGSTSLMDSGNQNNNGNTPPYYNALERQLLGLSEPELIENDGAYKLQPVNIAGASYRIDTETEGEYFLIEYRSNLGWDRHIGGEGMLLYHIDRSEPYKRAWTFLNTVNADQSHQCADIIEADSRKDGFADVKEYKALMENIGGIFFPYGDVDSVTPDGKPGLKPWTGASGLQSITSIKKGLNSLTFNVIGGSEESTPPVATSFTKDVFTDAAIVSFESSHVFDGEAIVSWGRSGKEMKDTVLTAYEPGRYAVVLEGLESSGKTYSVSVKFSIYGIEGESRSTTFMTGRAPTVEWPYIYLGSVRKNSDGTFPPGTGFPLRVYNAADAARITWYYDGVGITRDGSGYFHAEASGTLKAVVEWEDGSTDTIMRKITIKD